MIDLYPGDGDWTGLFSDIVGPEGRVCSFVPTEIAHLNNDPVGRAPTLAKQPGRENVRVASAERYWRTTATRIPAMYSTRLIKGETDCFAYRFVKL